MASTRAAVLLLYCFASLSVHIPPLPYFPPRNPHPPPGAIPPNAPAVAWYGTPCSATGCCCIVPTSQHESGRCSQYANHSPRPLPLAHTHSHTAHMHTARTHATADTHTRARAHTHACVCAHTLTHTHTHTCFCISHCPHSCLRMPFPGLSLIHILRCRRKKGW